MASFKPLLAAIIAPLLMALGVQPVSAQSELSARVPNGEASAANNTEQSSQVNPQQPSPEAAKLFEAGEASRASKDYSTAAAKFSQSCDLFYSSACIAAARVYLDDFAAQENDAKARGLFVRGCILQSAAACRPLASMLQMGVGGPVDKDGAISLNGLLCDANDSAGCAMQVVLLQAKYDAADDESERQNLLTLIRSSLFKACDLGDAISCVDAGAYAINGVGGPVELAKAAIFSRRGCDGGEAKACSNMGILARDGSGVAADPQAAIRYFNRACAGKVALACNNLGVMHADTGSRSKPTNPRLSLDFVMARRAFEKACAIDDREGCSNLAASFYRGEGTKQDFAQSMIFAQKACDLGHANGCYTAAVMYYQGQGVSRDFSKWMMLAEKACAIGHPQGCTNAAMIYWKGTSGVTPDLAKAGDYLKRGCNGGYDFACTNLPKLKTEMGE